MKYLTILFSIVSFNVSLAQILEFSVNDIRHITVSEKQIIKDYLNEPSRFVYVSSPNTDTVLFNMINEYRKTKNAKLKILKHSQRLDTLCNIIARKNVELHQMTHYTGMPELKNVYDLLNAENIIYNTSGEFVNRNSFSTNNESNDIVDLKRLLQGWINSPGHNKNLLADLEVGTVKILLAINRVDNSYSIDTYGVFEIDNSLSKRELNQLVIKSNEDSRQLVLDKIKKLRKKK